MLEDLKKEVYRANIELVEKGLVIYTWGNVSGIDKTRKYMVIKPSGVPYDEMKYDDMVVVDVKTGEKLEGKYKPSSDTLTHLEIYKNFKDIYGIAHSHSLNAVAFAQAGKPIKILGTTHADYFKDDIPCTRQFLESEVVNDYELNTGRIIVETIKNNSLEIPGVLVRNHGPFTWGKDVKSAVFNSVVLENVANMCLRTLLLNTESHMPKYISEKHYNRKNGNNSYYGQNSN